MTRHSVEINRAPVMTLWAAVVAERIGYDPDEALTFGKAVAGLNAQSKGRRLGVYEKPTDEEKRQAKQHHDELRREGREDQVRLLGRQVPVRPTPDGLRALVKDQPVSPAGVRRYLEGKFGDALPDVREALRRLAEAYPDDELEHVAYALYEEFRPEVSSGKKGWGQAGTLDLDRIRRLAEGARR